jgi:hypothetical protein
VLHDVEGVLGLVQMKRHCLCHVMGLSPQNDPVTHEAVQARVDDPGDSRFHRHRAFCIDSDFNQVQPRKVDRRGGSLRNPSFLLNNPQRGLSRAR